jgi:hypothetical protein
VMYGGIGLRDGDTVNWIRSCFVVWFRRSSYYTHEQKREGWEQDREVVAKSKTREMSYNRGITNIAKHIQRPNNSAQRDKTNLTIISKQSRFVWNRLDIVASG